MMAHSSWTLWMAIESPCTTLGDCLSDCCITLLPFEQHCQFCPCEALRAAVTCWMGSETQVLRHHAAGHSAPAKQFS